MIVMYVYIYIIHGASEHVDDVSLHKYSGFLVVLISVGLALMLYAHK